MKCPSCAVRRSHGSLDSLRRLDSLGWREVWRSASAAGMGDGVPEDRGVVRARRAVRRAAIWLDVAPQPDTGLAISSIARVVSVGWAGRGKKEGSAGAQRVMSTLSRYLVSG